MARRSKGGTPAEQLFHDCNRAKRNSAVRRASYNCTSPEQGGHFWFMPYGNIGRRVPIPGAIVGPCPAAPPTNCNPAVVGGVVTVTGTGLQPTEAEAVESRAPYVSLCTGPVPAACLVGLGVPSGTPRDLTGAGAAGASSSSAQPAASSHPSGVPSGTWGWGDPRER